MEVMVIQRELCAAVMLKVKAFFSDMPCHRNKWLNTGHSKRLKSYSMGMLRAFIVWKTLHFIGDSDSDSYLQYVHRFYFRYKEGVAGGRGESVGTNSGYTHQIAEIQHKQRKTKRHASVSSDNFSSSRSDSWRHGGRHCIQGMYRVKTLYKVTRIMIIENTIFKQTAL